MPIVRIEMWPGRTQSQKADLARVITEAMADIADTTAEATTVIFNDIARENWATGGVLASEC
jgi:4-oxalocrotonate tautomerase